MKRLIRLENQQMTIFIRIFSYLVATVFTFAAISKITDMSNFVKTIAQMELLEFIPADGILFLGIMLSIFELLTGAMLIIGRFRVMGAALSSGLLSFFIVFISFTLLKGKDLRCGYFGPWSQTFSPKLLALDVILLIFSLTIYVYSSKPVPKAKLY